MKLISCDRCGNPAVPFQDPQVDAVKWLPMEITRSCYRGESVEYTDLCGHCSKDLYEFLDLIDPVTRVTRSKLPQMGSR